MDTLCCHTYVHHFLRFACIGLLSPICMLFEYIHRLQSVFQPLLSPDFNSDKDRHGMNSNVKLTSNPKSNLKYIDT